MASLSLHNTTCADENDIRQAVTFYASFDESREGRCRRRATHARHPLQPRHLQGQYVVEKGIDAKVFTLARKKGIAGGALETVDVLPKNWHLFPREGEPGVQEGRLEWVGVGVVQD